MVPSEVRMGPCTVEVLLVHPILGFLEQSGAQLRTGQSVEDFLAHLRLAGLPGLVWLVARAFGSFRDEIAELSFAWQWFSQR